MDLIVAADKNWAIGKGGDLIYSIPEDMKFFRRTSLASSSLASCVYMLFATMFGIGHAVRVSTLVSQ